MTARIRFIIPLIIFALIIVLFKYGLKRDPNLLPSFLVNKSIPEFSYPSLQNQEQVLSEDLKGKITLLNVWASWCGACKIEHPLLIDIAKKNNVQVFGLNYKDNKKDALRYLTDMGNPYRNTILDADGKLAMQFGVYGTPETFLIDKKGVVRYRYVGPITIEILENDLIPRIKKIEEES